MDMDDERLHPDGAPGVIGVTMRQFFGDAEFERMMQANADNTEAQKIHFVYHLRNTALLSAMLGLAALFMLIAGSAVCVWLWRWALQ